MKVLRDYDKVEDEIYILVHNLALHFSFAQISLILIFGVCGTKGNFLDNFKYRWTIGVYYRLAVKAWTFGLL